MNKWELLAEIERRGELLPDEAKLLEQARAKGLAPAGSMSVANVASKAAENFLPSLGNFAYNLTAPIHSPVQTAKGLTHLAAGVGSKIVGAADRALEAIGGPDLQTPEQAETAEAPMKALGQFFADRYGSVEGFKKAVAEDPVGVLGDASAVVTGGGAIAARAPGLVGRAGQVAVRAGQAIDPVVATGRAVSGTVRAAAPAVGRVAGAYTGLGDDVLSDLYQAGRAGGPAMDTAIENMRGQVPQRNVVDQAQGAMQQLRRQRSQEYDANMAATRADQTQLDMNAVRAELQRLRDETNFRGQPGTGDPGAVNALDDIERLINQFDQMQGGIGRTAEGMDFLKQRIRDVDPNARQGTPANRVIGRMYNATRDQIARQVPDYAAAMQGYENASDLIDEASRTLSLNDRATIDTTLRKLQSTTRNNANTSYGQRGAVLDELEAVSPGLRPALAGQAASSWAPRGINRAGIAGGGMTGLAMGANPLTVGALAAASSPRLMGEGAVLSGRTAALLDNALGRLGINAGNVAGVTTPAQQVGRAGEIASPSKQEERALEAFRKASEEFRATGKRDNLDRTMNLLAQIVAKETGQSRETIMERLKELQGL